MVPRAISFLYVALVWSTFATLSETGGDLEKKDARNYDILENFPPNMRTHRTNFNFKYAINNNKYISRNSNNIVKYNNLISNLRQYNASGHDKVNIRKKRQEGSDNAECENFNYSNRNQIISPPTKKVSDSVIYLPSVQCETVIDVTSYGTNNIIVLNFVDMFHIEDHPSCEYDYLEIRDGKYGYSKLVNRYCGEIFPPTVTSTGPYLWLRFHSDENIEYEGFRINVKVESSNRVTTILPSCYIDQPDEPTILYNGSVGTAKIPDDCRAQASSQGFLDVLWNIETLKGTKIYLNFTFFELAHPNECNDNYVEVFDAKTDMDSRLELFCGSVANSVTTKGNLLYVHLFATSRALTTKFNAVYAAFRTLELTKDGKYEKCIEDVEFDCEDNTCIYSHLKCDGTAHCRLKADEYHDLCTIENITLKDKPHILIILIIFSLILSGMSFVFFFKCIRKLIQDHKLIKEHIRQSCEDRLDSLDVRKLHLDSEPRASLERDNHTNEMFKKQRSLSHHKERPTSIDSDFIQETHLDIEVDSWRRDIESLPIETENVRIEQNGRHRRSDISKKEESVRRGSKKEKAEVREKKEIRDVSVGAPDTKESSCQTRESLFQAGTASSEGTESGSGGRAFSTFGYSGATLVRPSPPAPPVLASEITLELLKESPSQESKSKKIPDRRPMSNETTRSAPDVIIVSKPIR